jgi:phosphate transport system permease protein
VAGAVAAGVSTGSGLDVAAPRPGPSAAAAKMVSSDRRAELLLGALAVGVLVLIGLMLVTVLVNAWPSFSANGLSWFGSGGDIVTQFRAMQANTALPGHSVLYFRAWPLLWGLLLTTLFAVVIALVISTLAAIFLTELAPAPARRALEPVIRLLAGVPSVIYGLMGILVVGPWIDGLISNGRKQSVAYVVQLSGENLLTATLILTVMILPIMISLTASALAAVPASWREGSVALGVNRWRTMWRVSLRAARPAISAAVVLATARALGEAVMLAMVSGGRPFDANPLDGLTFFFEPVETPATAILKEFGGETNTPIAHTAYALAAVLLLSAALLSFAGWAVKQPMKRYGLV